MSSLSGVADRARDRRRESPLPKQFEHSFDYCFRLHRGGDKNTTFWRLVSYTRSTPSSTVPLPARGPGPRARQNRSMQFHPNVHAVQDALEGADATDASGAPCRVRLLPDAVHTAVAAAAALNVQVGQIANSL